ncbi:MAG: hypothetical protein MUO97_03780 [Dehalococcoidia bacterium]|nr:hypothetical protein [Dehalococcoidia bacterium]
MYWDGFKKTRKGRIIYERKKHTFGWQRASRICYVLINDNLPSDKLQRYYPRMRAGIIGYSYAMLRMYPEFARSYLIGLARGERSEGGNQTTYNTWKSITMGIVEKGLDYLGPDAPGINEVREFAKIIANGYYDFLFSL